MKAVIPIHKDFSIVVYDFWEVDEVNITLKKGDGLISSIGIPRNIVYEVVNAICCCEANLLKQDEEYEAYLKEQGYFHMENTDREEI